MKGKQLIVRLHDFEYLDRVEDDGGKFKDAKGITQLTWPDGRLCFEATAYLHALTIERHASTQIRGGTPRTKAFHLSHLIRLCYQNKTDFVDLTDEMVSRFMQSLIEHTQRGDGSAKNGRRNGTTAHTIGCDWLDLLEFVGSLHGIAGLIGRNGVIRAQKVSKDYGGEHGVPKRTMLVWEHSALPTRDEYKTRRAMSFEVLNKLTAAVPKCIKSEKFAMFRKRQLRLILRLLRVTGLRRAELCMLRISDIEAAMSKKVAVLTVASVKKRRHTTRDIEIDHGELNEVLQFVKYFRKDVVEAYGKDEGGDGWLFVSSTTGERLSDNTITQWMGALRHEAGVEEQACAHMFRHLFAVERLCRLMEKHHKMTRSSFQEAMLGSRALKLEVMKELGHASEKSLEIYLNDAEAMLAELQKIKKSVRADLLDESLRSCEQQHQMRVAEGVPLVVSLSIFHESAMCIQRDADNLRSSSSG
ncbi:integrase [Paraburkholderia sp. RAU6.4a]|uniref:tyrosine-type recombinase/integrase n=1 Tax=Paraburkholderia sp. RAU6.4a TaxID=2991067 RepID=UPI003D1A5703